MCEKWKQALVPKEVEATVDVHEEMTKLTVSVISNLLFGSNIYLEYNYGDYS